MSELKAFTARIDGFVQGVGFRYSTLRVARRLGLKGYVQNLPGGGVKVVAEGEADPLLQLKAWLKHGPSGAYVRDIEIRGIPPSGVYRDFDIEF